MSTMQGVDCSFDLLTPEEAVDLKAAGVEVFMQCLLAQPSSGPVQPDCRVINLRNASMAGMKILGYIVLPSGAGAESGLQAVEMGRSGVPKDLWDRLLFVEADVELPMQLASIRNMVNRLAEWGKGKVIYTNYSTWANVLNNPKSFTDCLLHNANWHNAPNIAFASLPFGGWTIQQVLAEQWSGGTYVQGQFADRNTFVTELLLPAATDPCGLLKLRAQFLEEVARAAADGDYKTLVRWGQYLG